MLVLDVIHLENKLLWQIYVLTEKALVTMLIPLLLLIKHYELSKKRRKGVYNGEMIHYTKKDMANELVVWEAVKEVSKAVDTILSTYRQTHLINKLQKQTLNIKIKEYLAYEKGRTIGVISRNNICEISKTMELINSMNLEGVALAMAMENLEEQNRQLLHILEECEYDLEKIISKK